MNPPAEAEPGFAQGRSPSPASRLFFWGRWLVGIYLVLLAASHVVRLVWPVDAEPRPDLLNVELQEIDGERTGQGSVRLAYREVPPAPGAAVDTPAPVVLLVHGSPGYGRSVLHLGRLLARHAAVLIPDLPGFGGSTYWIPDYSIRAHASYLRQFLDSLGVDAVHVVGFSMGGGVGLELFRLAPERILSLTMLSSIGVQELELLGDYRLNHAIHALQLGLICLVQEGVPHFGRLDAMGLNIPYARNFYDTDQRRLRGLLERFDKPMLIVHGERDALVPATAAREHHRIVPQSRLVMLSGDHFLAFREPARLAAPVGAFIAEVERGEARTRAQATVERVRRAAQPFDPASVPGTQGFSLFVVLALIAAATLVSEDLTGIATGLLVARGSIGFVPGTLAVIIGIFTTDVLIYIGGRFLGRPALGRAPLKWLITPRTVERTGHWFDRRGAALIFLSRFTPGTRVATYIAAGMLRMRFLSFAGWLLLAVVLWVPIVVGVAAVFGFEIDRFVEPLAGPTWPWILGFAIGLYVVLRIGIRLFTFRGRRRLLGTWRRLTRWEFWPPWIFYLPAVAYVLWLGIKHRSLTLFTAANPALPDGGVVGESKYAIHRGLVHATDLLPKTTLLSAADAPDARMAVARAFMSEHELAFPVLIKPDVGERGRGVHLAHHEAELRQHVRRATRDLLLQEYIRGDEFGVFYYRMPHEARGRIWAITEKKLQSVMGDGKHSLEELILMDDQAVCQARVFLRRHEHRLDDVPAPGEAVSLGDLGNHCQGARFYDGTHRVTPALEEVVDRVSKGYEGFLVGRYDVRVPSPEDFEQGTNLTIIELNGVTSEATNIYDPKNSLWGAYRILFEQWRIIFRVAEANRKAGVRPSRLHRLLGRIGRHYFGSTA